MRFISGGMALMVLQDERGTMNKRTADKNRVLIMEDQVMA
jgi:hypothetical protein